MANDTAANTARKPMNMNAGTRWLSRWAPASATPKSATMDAREIARMMPMAKPMSAISHIGAHSLRPSLWGKA